MKKRILSILLVVCMVFAVIPVGAFTTDAGVTTTDTGASSVADSGVADSGEPDVCQHEHGEECGYIEAIEGADCTHACELCKPLGEAVMEVMPSLLTVEEQFTGITVGDTYYFDLSGEAGKMADGVSSTMGTINTEVPDTSLHYVPFTYIGTVNAYNLATSDVGTATTEDRANALKSDRSLFVGDYNVSHTISWEDLNKAGFIIGKIYDEKYILRSLSTGSNKNIEDNNSISPNTNEWDQIMDKSKMDLGENEGTDNAKGYIKNWDNISSWGQDTAATWVGFRTLRGAPFISTWAVAHNTDNKEAMGWRPTLEVMNAAMASDDMKSVALDFGGGSFGGNSIINIICAGDSFKAPSGEGLTRPSDNTGIGFHWNTREDGKGTSYAVGDSVPNTVTTLYAQWVAFEQFSLPVGTTYYFDLSTEKGNIGTINTALPDTTLHYVPFTYVGTVNAYNLATRDIGIATTEDRANALKSNRSLFVGDYNMSNTISWNDLNEANLILGKSYAENCTLRSLSTGRIKISLTTAPNTNEWDQIVNKSKSILGEEDGIDNEKGYIKNWAAIYSLGQDTYSGGGNTYRSLRGATALDAFHHTSFDTAKPTYGWRPAIEVLNAATLGFEGLKSVTLNLGGGSFGTNDAVVNSINMICAADSFKAPSDQGLTQPSGNVGTDFHWNTMADGTGTSYRVGDSVPNTVTTLYAHWTVPAEQFNFHRGGTYYFDLSAEKDNIGAINMALPDTTLHYVPFTYVGTINAYSLASGQVAADATATHRSLFVGDYAVSHTKSWKDLDDANLIFGKTYDENYALRVMSVGSNVVDDIVSPNTNEWDRVLDKSKTDLGETQGIDNAKGYIKNWHETFSIGQDTAVSNADSRVVRGYSSAAYWDSMGAAMADTAYGFRPTLEVLNADSLGLEGLKSITLDLGEGKLGSNSTINIIRAGNSFKAPSGEGLTRPNGDTGPGFHWNTRADGKGTIYAVGDSVPDTVTTLYAQWMEIEHFDLPVGGTYYFDLSEEAGAVINGKSDKLGTINAALPDTTLHYVPFTYVGTINAYSLASGQVAADVTATHRSLFVGDHAVSHTKSWEDLNDVNLLFGKIYDENYTLRAMSVGSSMVDDIVSPRTNEWDQIVNKSKDGLGEKEGIDNAKGYIKNWHETFSIGQDTPVSNADLRVVRGYSTAAHWDSVRADSTDTTYGFRPTLEVMNADRLGLEGLKSITLDLGEGKLGSNSTINMISVGNSFKAPSGEGLTRPSDDTGTGFHWNTRADGKGTIYAVGDSVPDTVTTLYAQWMEIEHFDFPVGGTYYFDLSGEAGALINGKSDKMGVINTEVPDTTLHYVPFTYVGTINAYSLTSGQVSTDATATYRSLFVGDYNVSHTKSWEDLNKANLIFGKAYDENYMLRSLSTGSSAVNPSTYEYGTPTFNEWDQIINKSKDRLGETEGVDNAKGYIKNWIEPFSMGQDTVADAPTYRALRGGDRYAHCWTRTNATYADINTGWRPVLEVLDAATLTSEGLKSVTLDLGGGSFDSNGSVAGGIVNSMHIICIGDSFKAPSGEGLTPPEGKRFDKWQEIGGGRQNL